MIIYRLLYARIGRTYSPVSGREVKRHSADDLVKFLGSLDEGTRVIITSPAIIPDNIRISEYISFLVKQGFNRVEVGGELIRTDEPDVYKRFQSGQKINIVIDGLL
jgi:excinuclease ABC subunit A